MEKHPIGVFDSGYGGLTILRDIRRRLPLYDYLYLGDNARAPYGSRSFEIVHRFTHQAVSALFDAGCELVILACNTASAKALRTIQQQDLPLLNDPLKRVLGVIRPTIETVGSMTRSRHIGVLGTVGTIQSQSYVLEMKHSDPDIVVTQQACPMWVPIVEYGEALKPGADYFVKQYLDELLSKDPLIDTLILGCTHYPILIEKIRKYAPDNINILAQGPIVAESLADYLRRHPEIESRCSKNGTLNYLTTENPEKFDTLASMFMESTVNSKHIDI